MHHTSTRALAFLTAVAILVPAAAMAAVPREVADAPGWQTRSDKRSHPLGDARTEHMTRALEARLKGKAQGQSYEVVEGEFVELALEGTDMVWTVPGEFADYPHNSIPEPDRSVDNSTIWVEDFGRDYYLDLLFAEGAGANSMREYFLEQSSGRYTVTGDVAEWVPVPGNAVDYDDGDPGPGVATNVWLFLADSLDGWYDMQRAAGTTEAEIEAYLAAFDVWDRYDWDGDGDFDEPDGYIDHFQSLHSGEGNEAGGGELGDDSIWSHSWYAYYSDIGVTGPTLLDDEGEPVQNALGGIRIGETDYWIGDYTIQPENGGVGVFVHEFTHDLGLPDLYDTSGAGENSTGFWTLMSSGSWLSEAGSGDIGSKPCHEGPWEKLMLGWLDYAVAEAGATAELTIGPAEFNSTRPQALVVELLDKYVEMDLGEPYAGEWMYYSGSGDMLDNVMYRPYVVPAGASLEARVFYEIELDWDYAYLVVSTDGGATWATVPTNLSTDTNPNGNNLGNGITGTTRKWTRLKADLSAYPGPVLLGFRYRTDEAVSESGFRVDEIAVTGSPTDGAETADAGWTFNGFKRTSGLEAGYFHNYYLAEYRQYWGYDAVLANCYNFGFLKDRLAAANLVEHFPYQDGLLVWYCDASQADNNTGVHPGSGFALPVDARPEPLIRPDKKVWRNRVQIYDATFGLEPSEAITLHYNSRPSAIAGQAAVPVFDDALSYWSPANPTGSVITPVTGTRIEVLGTSVASDGGAYMGVRVTAPVIE
jgi:immune inhibitor A